MKNINFIHAVWFRLSLAALGGYMVVSTELYIKLFGIIFLYSSGVLNGFHIGKD